MDSTAIGHALTAWHAPIWSHEHGSQGDGTRFLRATSPFPDTKVSDPKSQSAGRRSAIADKHSRRPPSDLLVARNRLEAQRSATGRWRLPPRRQARLRAAERPVCCLRSDGATAGQSGSGGASGTTTPQSTSRRSCCPIGQTRRPRQNPSVGPLQVYRGLTVEVTSSAGSPGSIRPCPRCWPGFLTTTRTRLRSVL
jgi:hypothetical protein